MASPPVGLEYKGLRETNAYLKKIGVPDDAIKTAMNEAGQIVAEEAGRLAPVESGRLKGSIKVNKAKNKLVIKVGNNTTVPYAYTFHAVALGLSKGGFTFRVPPHTRRGRPVSAYKAKRYIPNRPFLYTAWERKKSEVIEAYVNAIGDLIKGA